jgi:small-conductance mechanosensitive channel
VQEQIKLAFDAAQIQFPFPTRTLHMIGDGGIAAKNDAA